MSYSLKQKLCIVWFATLESTRMHYAMFFVHLDLFMSFGQTMILYVHFYMVDLVIELIAAIPSCCTRIASLVVAHVRCIHIVSFVKKYTSRVNI